MKGQTQNQNLVTAFTKLFNAQLQLINVLSLFFLFGCGLATGVILSSYLNNISFNLQVSHFSFSTTTTTASPTFKLPPRVGLKEYLKVPDVKHDMDEKELLWRASVTPNIREFPFDRVPKVAFMFLTKGPVLMAPLWEKFFKGHDGFEVQWGNANMIEAERRLLANALLDIANQRFVLLSESCIPLFNFSTVYTYLMNSTESHVESYVLEGPVGNGRYSPRMRPGIKIDQWRKGSQWFEIDRDLAIEIVSDRRYFPYSKSTARDNVTLMSITYQHL
ncbi:hypothetical protein NC651_023423 [Populus alba x Populus x berolinensis]|nr:hypothetical protein NC651_023423 [Populus alba x Populus x berolinensis]